MSKKVSKVAPKVAKKVGFAALSKAKRAEISRKGGLAAQKKARSAKKVSSKK